MGEPEWRIDAADGCVYTLEDFIQEYGGSLEKPPPQWSQSAAATKEQIDAALRPDEEEENEDAEDGSDGDDGEEEDERPPPPSWLPAFELEGEPLFALTGIVEAMRDFGVAIDEGSVSADSLGIPPKSKFAKVLAEIKRKLLNDGGLVLLRGVPIAEEPSICKVLLSTLVAGLGLRPVRRNASATSLVWEAEAHDRCGGAQTFPCDASGTMCAPTPSCSSGGSVRLVSARVLHETIATESPERYTQLCKGWPVDTLGRGETQPQVEEQPSVKQSRQEFAEHRPLLWGGTDDQPHCARFSAELRRQIEISCGDGDAATGARACLDLLEEVAAREQSGLTFAMAKGDLLLVNTSRWMQGPVSSHSQTAEPAREFRVWLAQ